MKLVHDRSEIAYALNSGKFPVLTIDMEHEMEGYAGCYSGCKVNVVPKSERLARDHVWTRGTLKFFGDSKKLEVMPESVCLSSHYGYSDVMRSVEFANAPLIKEGDIVTLVIDFPEKTRSCLIKLMRVGRVSDHVFPVCCLEDIPDEEVIDLKWRF